MAYATSEQVLPALIMQIKGLLAYDDLIFDITATEAHLPSGIFWFDSWWGRYGWFLLDGVEKRFYYLIVRVLKCNI